MKEEVAEGRLQILGVIQEQHADRCRLFAQWKQFDWPIVQDAINVLQPTAVPILVAIDEQGVVRSIRPRMTTFKRDFLDKRFAGKSDSKAPADKSAGSLTPPQNFAALKAQARKKDTALAWRRYADALALWGGQKRTEEAIEVYRRVIERQPKDADAHFRLGVCLRRRFEAPKRQSGDFQAAVQAWEEALTMRPNQYIWRRRIQQYGPRLIKPYPFYDWVKTAQADIQARGEKPVTLVVAPSGAEIAHPSRRFSAQKVLDVKPPDPQGKIHRDKEWIDVQTTVVPSRIKPGQAARVHLNLFPRKTRKAHWNNEVEPLRLWVDPPSSWQVSHRLLSAPQPKQAVSEETRHLEFEIHAPTDAASGNHQINGYVLYYVCEDENGQCLFLRKDISAKVQVD